MDYTLAEIEPVASEIKLDKTYSMRVFNINDAVYFEQKYGAGYYIKMLKSCPTGILTEIAYRLINYNEDGDMLSMFDSLENFRKRINVKILNSSDLMKKVMDAYGFALKSVEETPKKK